MIHDHQRHLLSASLERFIRQASWPCVGAKSALARGGVEVVVARSIASAWDDVRIARRLIGFAHAWSRRPDRRAFRSLAVLFEGPLSLDEAQFERHLWARVQSLSDKDAWLGQRVDPKISVDPRDPRFALSFGGQAFFVVGLHPRASRRARRFRAPALIFNLHDQFRLLRRDGRYETMRATILQRDVAYSGSVNPMLARHGEAPEARQYSGRRVEADWACPFHRRAA